LTSKMEYTDDDLIGIVFMPPKGDVVNFEKYSNAQARDGRGRWTSGGGGLVEKPKPLNQNNNQAVADQVNFQRKQGFTKENFPPEIEESLKNYTNGSGQYNNINGILRDPNYPLLAGLNETSIANTQQDIKNLDTLINSAPPTGTSMLTYRGIQGEAVDQFLALKVGDSYTEKGFVSTSWDNETAKQFANDDWGQSAVLEVINPVGTKGVSTLGFRTEVKNPDAGFQIPEQEWLLPRNSSFEVVGKQGKTLTVRLK